MSDEIPPNGGRMPDGTFAPGNRVSKGRALGSRNKATVVLDALADGEADGVLREVLSAAKGGDMRAAELVLSRCWPIRKGRPVQLDLPAVETAGDVATALGELIRAVAAGEVTPEEAGPVAGMLDARRRAIETAELEDRIRKLEESR